MSNYKSDRKNQINLRISDKELSALDSLVKQKSSCFNTKSRTDILVEAVELMKHFNFDSDKRTLMFVFEGVKFNLTFKNKIDQSLIDSINEHRQTEIPAYNIIVTVNEQHRLIL